jgi:hypothetical protein
VENFPKSRKHKDLAFPQGMDKSGGNPPLMSSITSPPFQGLFYAVLYTACTGPVNTFLASGPGFIAPLKGPALILRYFP